ncbi:MAG: family oxidoreductase [Rhodospirillales bacterium]|jgi:NAD(P)-dependent dehydrogenase (short-subunit alcohol dehydrogenase family)|nr:family oxidoreductase [Rhodospirillales bacterium]
MNELQDKVAIVTGASAGMGEAIAAAFAGAGARLVLAARRRDLLDAVAGRLRDGGGTALAVPTDVTDEDEVAALFRQAIAAFGRVDILVNNAGVSVNIPTDALTLADWRRVIDVNLTGAFLCGREALRVMKTQGGGRILNIGSVGAKVPRRDAAPYTASKFALEGLTRSLALDGREHGIAASIIHPGNTATSFGRQGTSAVRQEGAMTPADVARVVLLMASLPATVNLLETIMLPVSMPFLGRG